MSKLIIATYIYKVSDYNIFNAYVVFGDHLLDLVFIGVSLLVVVRLGFH